MTKAREIAELGQKLTVDASGNIDVAGSVTADQLTVEGDTKIRTTGNNMLSLVDTSASFRPSIRFMKDDGGGETALHMLRDDDGALGVYRGGANTKQFQFESNGDVTFYDNSGAGKAVWDSSAGTLGIGTDTPNTGSQLHVDGGTGEGSFRIEGDTNTKISQFASTTGSNFLYFGDTDSYNSGQIRYTHSSDIMTLKAASQITFQTGVSERVRIDENGNVGIGTANPDTPLHVVKNANSSQMPIVLANENATANSTSQTVQLGFGLSRDSGTVKNDAGVIAVGKDSAWTAADTNIDSYMAFQTYTNNSATEKMRINSSGRVGIGTTSPMARLEVEDAGTTTGVILKVTADDSGPYAFVVGNDSFSTVDTNGLAMWVGNDGVCKIDARGTGAYHTFRVQGTERMRINSSGNVGIGGPATTGQGRLHVYGATPYIDIQDTTSGQWDQDDVFSGIRFRTSDPDVGGAGQVHASIKAIHTRSGTGHSNPDAGLVFSTSTGTTPSPTERMRITEDGFVGINETNPTAPLHITRNDNSDLIMLECTDGDATEGPQMHLYRNSASPANGDDLGVIKFRGKNSNGSEINYAEIAAFATTVTAGAEDTFFRVLITKNGNQVNALGVGHDEIVVNENSNDMDFRVESNGNANMFKVDGGTNSVLVGSASEINSTTTALNVTSSGRALDIYRSTATATNNVLNVYSNFGGTKTLNAVIDVDGDMENTNARYTALSDQRFKQDIVDATSQWDDIKALQFRKYRLINLVEQLGDDAPVHMGVIAQELEASGMGSLVKTKPLDEDNPDAGDRKTVAYSILYMKAVKALQEAMERIETLETEQTAIKARLDALEAT